MIIHGELDAFFETGTEGVIWAVWEDGKAGYDGLYPLRDGDRLTILAPDGEVLWTGTIDEDRESNWEEYPGNPGHGQQCACGMWVHWLQRGVAPEVWFGWFRDGKRAILERAEA